MQMDPLAGVNYDYAIFRNGGLPQAPASGPTQFPGGFFMLPVPEDQPFRPAFFLGKEDVMRRMEGALFIILILLAFIFRSWLLAGLLLGLAIFLIYVYLICDGDVTKHYREEKLRWEGKLVRGPNAKQLYIAQNL